MMRLRANVGLLLALGVSSVAHAQSQPNWVSKTLNPGAPAILATGPNSVQSWLGAKADATNGKLINPTISGGTIDGSATSSVMMDPAATMTDSQVQLGTVCASPAAVAAGNIAVPGQACFHSRFPAASWTQFQVNGESDQGGSKYYNVQLGVTGNAMAGAGLFWNFNPVLTLQPGSSGGTNGEFDLNNFACDAGTFGAGTSYGGTQGCSAPSYNIWLTGNSAYLATAYMNFASAGRPQAHGGEQWLGNLVQEFVWFEKTNAELALDFEGTHAADIDTRASTCLRDCYELAGNQGFGWYDSKAGLTTAAAYNAGIGNYLGGMYVDNAGNLQIRNTGSGGVKVTGGVSGAAGTTLTDGANGTVLANTIAEYMSAPSIMFGTQGGLVADQTAPAQIYAPFGAQRAYTVNAETTSGGPSVEQAAFGWVPGVGAVLRSLVPGQPLTILNASGAFVAKYNDDQTVTIGSMTTVAKLPACSGSTQGERNQVTDATSPSFLGALTGGGSTVTPVFCNGSAWVAG